MTDDEYAAHLDQLILALARDEFITADQLAARMHPGHPLNIIIFKLVKKHGITPKQLEVALEKRRKAGEAEKVLAEREQRTRDVMGCFPQTERETVVAMIAQGFTANYACEFIDSTGKVVSREDMLRDIQLTAADLRLTKKPLELKDKNFERALGEWCKNYRKARLAEVLALIGELSAGRDRETVRASLLRACTVFFREPEYALASIEYVIWQAKRKMLGLTVPEPLFTVLYGKQRGGKTYFWGYLKAPLIDLTKQVDVGALVAESSLDLYYYFIIDTDEMSKAERADLSKLKTILTASTVTRRIYYTQTTTDVPMQATCVGTCNFPIDTMIQDSSGMRRFNQLDVRPRKEIEPHWQDVVNCDWLGVWQSVDPHAVSPMEPFFDELLAKQERMRVIERVEMWLQHYEFDKKLHPYIKETMTDRSVQFHALKLFKVFQQFEAENALGQPMGLGTWGKRFKTLIDDGSAEGWYYHEHGRRCIYTFAGPNVVSIGVQQRA